MKVELYAHLCMSEVLVTASDMSKYYPLIKKLSVTVPDNMLPSADDQKRLIHSWSLEAAQKDIEEKQDELAAAEEVLKNLLAIEHEVQS